MDVARWEQIKELFDAALDRLPAERAAFLATACGADAELLREVELLLTANAEAGGFMNAPALQWAAQHLVADEEPVQQFGSLIGQQLSHYKILSLIGTGGMGEVYLAYDTSLERRVALKLLPLKFTQVPEHLQRFIREAKAASALNHPNIITIHEIGEFGELHFIATEFIEGVTLRQRLADGSMPLREVLDVTRQVAAALEAAHNAGITHRDIKPENVMLRPDGLVKVLDFGLAKLTPQVNAVTPEAASHVQTTPGLVMGTPRYMSPEQARGQKTDARSDLFSLGVVLYEMVTGAQPFPGATSAEVFAALLDKDPPPLADFAPETPDELERIVGKALRKVAEERYQSSGELLADLKQVGAAPEHPLPRIPATPSGQPLSKSVSEQTKSAVRPRRHRAWQVISACLLLSVSAGAVYWLTQSKKIFRPPPRILPLTTFPGLKDHACFSPDGSYFAFAWSGKDAVYVTRDIYIKVVGTGEPLQLTNTPDDDSCPAWSPDGRYIAFLRNGDAKGVYLVSALGGAARRIGDGVYTLSWSPDGRTLVTCSRPTPERPNSDLMLLSVETGEARALTRTSMPVSEGQAAFSPDGKQIAFIRSFSMSARDVFTIPSGGGTPHQLTFDRRPLNGGLTWTSDSREIIYSANLGGGPNLWRISAEGGTAERMNLGVIPSSPAISRSGNLLAWTENYTDTNIYHYEGTGFGGSGVPSRLAPQQRLIHSSREDHSPQISPDGARIVFVSTRTGSEELWVCDRNGGNLRQLTFFDGPPTGTPRWSPDGRWIAFDSRAGGSPDIYVISADGGAPRRLTSEITYEATPSWSGDGRWIYFASNRSGAENIWKMLAEGGAAAQLTHGGAFEGFESPDGKLFYFSKRNPNDGFWSVPTAGGAEKPVPEFVGIRLGRSWGLLPQGIYFITREDALRPAIRFFSFATRRITTLAKVEKAPLDLQPGLALSPDGRWLLYAQRDQIVNDIMLMENFR
ncbi:MAG: protein kinase [Blastocatellales bacterium]